MYNSPANSGRFSQPNVHRYKRNEYDNGGNDRRYEELLHLFVVHMVSLRIVRVGSFRYGLAVDPLNCVVAVYFGN
jgi:hypothetical protein